jgi:hypothetical protein
MATDPEPVTEPPGEAGVEEPTKSRARREDDAGATVDTGDRVDAGDLVSEPGDADEIG